MKVDFSTGASDGALSSKRLGLPLPGPFAVSGDRVPQPAVPDPPVAPASLPARSASSIEASSRAFVEP